MITQTLSLYKRSFTGLSRETWLLSFIMLINRSGTMVVPFMTLYLTSAEMGRSLSEAGVVMGLFGLGAMVGAFFGGKFSDRVGFYNIQLFALVVGGILFIMLGQLRSYPLICLFTFILSMVNEAFRPANSSAIAFYSKPENRTRSYSLNRLAINLGWAFGASLGGFIASRNYTLLFWVDGLTNILAAVLMLLFLRQGKASRAHAARQKEAEPGNSAYRDKNYIIFIALAALFAICFFQMFSTVPKHMRDNMGLNEQFIGQVMALNGILIVAIEMVLIYKLEGRRSNLHYIIAGVLTCAVGFLSLLVPGNARAIALIMILFITIGEVLAMPFMNSYWVSRSNERNRGQYAALYSICWAGAQAFGPFIFSILADRCGFNTLFVAMGILTAISAAGFYLLYKAEHKAVIGGEDRS